MHTKTQNARPVKPIVIGRTDTHTLFNSDFLQDSGVSYGARGFAVYLLSHDDWIDKVKFPSIASSEFGYLQEIENNGYCLFDKGE